MRIRCDLDVGEADCLRSLADVACSMGADVVWGVGDAPTQKNARNWWQGRAAHTAPAKDGGAAK